MTLVQCVAKLIVNCPKPFLSRLNPTEVVEVAEFVLSGRIAASSANVVFKSLYEQREDEARRTGRG